MGCVALAGCGQDRAEPLWDNELSSMTRQSLHGRRFSTIAAIRKHTTAWATATNRKQRGVDWQFQIENARTTLKYLYPKIRSR